MSDQPHPSAPAPRDDAALPATRPLLDANGFDPADYKWIPVARRERADGWTADKQRAFIERLAETCSVSKAAEAVHMDPSSAYRLKRAAGGEQFAAAWAAALREGVTKLEDAMMHRAIDGVEEPVFYKGERIGARIKYDNRLGMFLLRAHQPERYAPERLTPPPAPPPAPAGPPAPHIEPAAATHRIAGTTPSGPPAIPAGEVTLGDALEALSPIVPENPHLLMPAEQMEDELLLARAGRGHLPVWHDPIIGPRMGPERASALADAKRRFGKGSLLAGTSRGV